MVSPQKANTLKLLCRFRLQEISQILSNHTLLLAHDFDQPQQCRFDLYFKSALV